MIETQRMSATYCAATTSTVAAMLSCWAHIPFVLVRVSTTSNQASIKVIITFALTAIFIPPPFSIDACFCFQLCLFRNRKMKFKFNKGELATMAQAMVNCAS